MKYLGFFSGMTDVTVFAVKIFSMNTLGCKGTLVIPLKLVAFLLFISRMPGLHLSIIADNRHISGAISNMNFINKDYISYVIYQCVPLK
jgi:hypothetical protein